MQFVTPYTPDSIPSFCSLLEHYRATVVSKKNLKGWAKACIAQKTWKKAYYRARASEAQNHRCCYCGIVMHVFAERKNSITLEHVTPRSLGGLEHPDNYVAACRKCNTSRGNKPVDIFLKEIGLTLEPNLL